jgi:hypothetical protein
MCRTFTFSNMMLGSILRAMRRERALMQLVRVMQNLLMILLTLAGMNPTMRLYPRRMLMYPRHLVRVPTMIGRLSHVLMRPTLRHHRTLTTTTTLEIHLTRMMKPSLVLSHKSPHCVAVAVYVYECANPFRSVTVPLACVFCSMYAILNSTSTQF